MKYRCYECERLMNIGYYINRRNKPICPSCFQLYPDGTTFTMTPMDPPLTKERSPIPFVVAIALTVVAVYIVAIAYTHLWSW